MSCGYTTGQRETDALPDGPSHSSLSFCYCFYQRMSLNTASQTCNIKYCTRQKDQNALFIYFHLKYKLDWIMITTNKTMRIWPKGSVGAWSLTKSDPFVRHGNTFTQLSKEHIVQHCMYVQAHNCSLIIITVTPAAFTVLLPFHVHQHQLITEPPSPASSITLTSVSGHALL